MCPTNDHMSPKLTCTVDATCGKKYQLRVSIVGLYWWHSPNRA